MAKVIKRKSSQLTSDKVKFNFDVRVLNLLIQYTQCEYVSKSELLRLKKLFDSTDPLLYQGEVSVYSRIRTIQSIVKSIVDLGLSNPDLIRNQLRQEFDPGIQVIDDIGFEKNKLSIADCEYLTRYVNENIQCMEIHKKYDRLVSLLNQFKNTIDYNVSYEYTINEFKKEISELMVSLQDTSETQGLLKEFAFSSSEAASMLASVVMKMQRPTAILQTGIRQLNAILSPGFQSGRLYTILGGSGKFKSGTLLNLADQIRMFNPQIIPYENGMRKCVLFITLENSIEETIERLYDMYSGMDADLRNLPPEDIVNTLRTEGGLDFSNSDGGIDICFRYAGNLEISTGDIYGIVSELNNKGLQPLCIVLDYIKRIDSAHPSNGDERVRMSYVAKELKTIAQYYQIPVITAMQLNREGNSIIDAAMRDSKQDVARFVGSSSIGNAWDIIEDSDWVCLINLELQKSSQRLFLTFKRLKIRGKKTSASDYFNHPFINAKNIRLEPDVDKEAPISVISLANDLESIEEENDENKKNNLTNLSKRDRERKSSESILSSLKGTLSPSNLL